MLKNYFLLMFRNLRRTRTFSFLNIFGLAIGIACAGLIFLWVEGELHFDNINEKKDRLYAIRINMKYAGAIYTMGSTPRPIAAALKKEIPGIANTARMSDQDERLLFSFNNKSLYASGRYADPSLFSMFTLNFVQGNAKDAFRQLYSLVITEKTAKKFFGDEKFVIGKTVRIVNKQDFVITGVLKDLPENSSLQFEWLAPYEVTLQDRDNNDALDWGSYGPYTYVELNEKTDPIIINKQLKDFITRKEPDQKKQAFLFPMSDWRLYNEFENGKKTGGGRIKQVRTVSIIGWIILLIACINFMNLATANSQNRSREVGVRKVLGASRRKLVLQFISEAMFMSVMAAILAILIISVTLPAFNTLVQKQLSLNINNPYQVMGLFGITIICGLIAGSYPSLYLSSFKPVIVLKNLKLKHGSAALIRKGLVVLQFAVSIVFIISTIIIYNQVQHVKKRNLGLNKNNLIEIDMQRNIGNAFPLIKEDLLHSGFVENIAMSDHATLYGGNTDEGFRWQGKDQDKKVSVAFRNVSPEFISTSGMKIIEGRDFQINTASEISNVIITKSFSKILCEGSAIGKIIQSRRGNKDGSFSNLTVVGVIDDYVHGNIYGISSDPVLFFCRPPENSNLLYIRMKPQGQPEQALAGIGAVMKKNNPAYPFEFKFVDDQFNSMFQNEMVTSKLCGVFATLAIIISCLGLLGLVAYTTERRTKEIGVRKVLGASVANIAGLLSKDFLSLVFIGCLIAFPVAWGLMNNWLQEFAYRINIGWWIFVVAGMAALLIALFTVSFQTVRAAIADPAKSLRTE
jgi:putative ABC transport system permease protein